ncbi:putative ribonuclease H-like domain-containing protein [Tanacetum coccineum]
MTRNKSYLSDYEEIDGGFVAFGGSTKGGKITGKGKIRTSKLDFKDVYFVKELKFNLFSVLQMCDKKNSILFTDTECVVLSPDFKLLDENQILLRVPRKNNMYSVDLKNVAPSGGIENQINHRVKIIRCDNKTEFKNKEMNQFCMMKRIKREFNVVRTPQQNGVAKKKNRTLIEAVKTMLADSQLPTTFWAEAVNTTCYVQNREPVVAGNQSNGIAGTKACENVGKARVETVPGKNYILLPFLTQDTPFSSSSKDSPNTGFKPSGEDEKKDAEHLENKYSKVPNTEEPRVNQEQDESVNSTNNINTISSTINTASIEDNAVDENTVYGCVDDPNMPNLEEIVYSEDDEGVGAEADMNNLDTFMPVSPIPTTRIHKDHPFEQIIRDLHSAPQTRRMTKSVTEHGMFSSVQQRINHKDFQNCLFACFLSQAEPKKVIQALKDPSWIEAMQEELLQFKLQQVWTLVDLPYGKRAIGTKWVYRNKKDERGIVIRNKARLFLAYASFKDFVVYQMDVKSAFLYGKIEEEVYVCQPLGFEDPEFPDRVYKVEKALYGLHQAPRAWYETLSTYLLDNGFQRGKIDKTLFIKRVKSDILLVQVYVDDIIFGSTKKSLCTEFEKLMHKKFQISSMASTPMETTKPLIKDKNAENVNVYLYRSMIGALMYLTSLRPDIIFVVCACARFQVTPKVLHLHAVKRIFKYLKGQPKLDLWYPKDSPFDLEAYADSDYAGASLDKKSKTGGCQFLISRLISWQCKKQTIVTNSTTEAEYVAAASCCGQVLWIQNQILDYGYNFMNTKIFIDNESTICIVKNPVFHSNTKHIEIRHHFIRDSYEKRLIQVIKIHTDHNVIDLLTKAFDVSRFQYLIASIGMLNP